MMGGLATGVGTKPLFKLFILPTLPNEVPLTAIFLIWIFFNWYIFSNVMLRIVKLFGGSKNLKNKKIAYSLVGFSNTAFPKPVTS